MCCRDQAGVGPVKDFEDDIAKTPYSPLPDCYPRDVALKLLALITR